jgi:MurNAc alpha-1-phosphate uridylyltransferase
MLGSMKAMIFAAGVGSRLGHFTQSTPKCLMPLGKGTILEHVISRLKLVGVHEVVINLHHFPDQIINYLARHQDFGLTVHLSHEPVLLNTGGGLKNVRDIFIGEDSFLVHNADIYCTHDLTTLLTDHRSRRAVATLGVMRRESKRGLYIDDSQRLTGWTEEKKPEKKIEKNPDPTTGNIYAFSGISVCSDEIFSYMDIRDTFSIIETFLAAARATERVFGSPIPSSGWVDIGSPERLLALQKELCGQK